MAAARLGSLAAVLVAAAAAACAVPGAVLAQDAGTTPPLSVDIAEWYVQGDTVVVSGAVRNIDPAYQHDVTIIIMSPSDNRVGLGQAQLAGDGTYSYSLLADGPLWKDSGQYRVLVSYGAQKSEAAFRFTSGDADGAAATTDPGTAEPPPDEPGTTTPVQDDPPPPPPPPPPPTETPPPVTPPPPPVTPTPPPPPVTPPPPPPQPQLECGPGTHEEGGTCVPDEAPEPAAPTCPAGQVLEGGRCVDIAPALDCGPGTVEMDGQCVPDPDAGSGDGGGSCLIATAAHGTELAPQVQMLREIRDGTVMGTASGASFMSGFNAVYYAFAPAVADLERENPAVREAVRISIAPMLASLSIMSLAEGGSDAQVLALGAAVIALNLGLYVAAPAVAAVAASRALSGRTRGGRPSS